MKTYRHATAARVALVSALLALAAFDVDLVAQLGLAPLGVH